MVREFVGYSTNPRCGSFLVFFLDIRFPTRSDRLTSLIHARDKGVQRCRLRRKKDFPMIGDNRIAKTAGMMPSNCDTMRNTEKFSIAFAVTKGKRKMPQSAIMSEVHTASRKNLNWSLTFRWSFQER